jgi:hypothetical protein
MTYINIYESNGYTWSTNVAFWYLHKGYWHMGQPKQTWRGPAYRGFEGTGFKT